MTARLACSGLCGGYGETTVFRSIDLDVGTGEVLALLGPNGAGKTTLLATLAGLLKAKDGSVSIDGEVLGNGHPSAANRAGLVLVPDNRSLFTSLTVEENLRVATRRGGPDPRSVLDIFPRLEERWKVKVGAISGGEQQMLAVARGLVQGPKVLLIDELSMGLAPRVVESLFEVIGRVAKERGCTIVLVEQHVSLALESADRAVVLTHGNVALSAGAGDLLRHPDLLEQAYLGAAAPAAVALGDDVPTVVDMSVSSVSGNGTGPGHDTSDVPG